MKLQLMALENESRSKREKKQALRDKQRANKSGGHRPPRKRR